MLLLGFFCGLVRECGHKDVDGRGDGIGNQELVDDSIEYRRRSQRSGRIADRSLFDALSVPDIMSNLLGGFGSIDDHVLRVPSLLQNIMSDIRSSRNVQFSFSEGRKTLIARIRIPSAQSDDNADEKTQRNVRVAVLGNGGHLRLGIETITDNRRTLFQHVFPLPVLVSRDEISTVPNADGSVSVSLRVTGEKRSLANTVGDSADNVAAMPDSPSWAHFLFGRHFWPNSNFELNALDDDVSQGMGSAENDSGGVMMGLPRKSDFERCRSKFNGSENRLQVRECVCQLLQNEDSKSLCYASLLSSVVQIARRLNKDDLATSAKHSALDCADHSQGKAACLQEVTKGLLADIYGNMRDEGTNNLSERLRAAIESEDDGPSYSEGRGSFMVSVVLTLGLVVIALFCWFAKCRGLRRIAHAGSSPSSRSSNDSHSHLTSVLSQLSGNVASARSPAARSSSKLA